MPFDADKSPRAVLDELASHPKGEALARLTHAVALTAHDERRTTFDDGLDEAATRLGVDEPAAETSFGNVLRALRKHDAATGPERTLLAVLIGRGVALQLADKTQDDAAVTRVAEALAWLSAHTIADPLNVLDVAAPDLERALLGALATAVRSSDNGTAGSLDRPSAIAASLVLGRRRASLDLEGAMAQPLRDPLLASLWSPPSTEGLAQAGLTISAEETAAPRGPILTLLLTVTFILPALDLARLFGRFALQLRRPAEVLISKEGVRIKSRIELLGKILRENEVFIPSGSLVRAGREIRYPRVATYVGIASLLVGSFIGLRLVLTGAKKGAPEFLGLGLLILLVALAVDYGLTLLPRRNPATCRLVLQPQRGRVVSLRDVELAVAERALRRLAP